MFLPVRELLQIGEERTEGEAEEAQAADDGGEAEIEDERSTDGWT